jgi:Ran GTPase-activating protein (RanGAP) involved in mRNA processing and transport
VQCAALAHLNLSGNFIKDEGAERFAGVLGQCSALTHLNLGDNRVGDAGAESLARVLGRCTALAQLDLYANDIGAVGEGRVRASWCGQSSGLAFVEVFVDDGEEVLEEEDVDDIMALLRRY